MFQDDVFYSVFMFCIAAWLFRMWLGDARYFSLNGDVRKGAFEGASFASRKLIVLAVVGAACLLALHSFSEISAGVSDAQTKVSAWALLSWLGAAFVEELIFRGYLVVKNRGVYALVGSIFLFSFLFAAAHPFVWNYEVPDGASLLGGIWTFNPSLQAWLSTLAIFECSVFFYILRFLPANKTRSILPCIAAHATYNVGVFAIKLVQGFVEW